MREASTLPAALRVAAERHPRRGIGIFDRRGARVERRTYPEILDGVQRGAARWRALGLEPGDRVLVALPTSWEWMEAWLGALLVGAWPAAVAPPGAMGASEGYGARIERLAELVGARRLVAPAGLRDDLRRIDARSAAAFVAPEELRDVPVSPGFEPPAAEPHDVAFLQFTSGSTGVPRAVMIPHRAVLHNSRASDEAIGAPHGRPASAWAAGMVSWLPMHHDMGLVGCLFLSIDLGLDLWLLNPTTFLARPRLWLEKLAGLESTFAPAPNFGYQLCAERIAPDELRGLDLGGWRAALTGAEMVRPETAAAFTKLTARCGFEPHAMRPCYGLAEGTLAVTFDLRGRGVRTLPVPEGADAGLGLGEVVCLGVPVRDTHVVVRAPDDSTLPEGAIGEVCVRGPGVFAGYYNDASATAECLRQGWLYTGDLGFLRDGELYLTGRVKDVLIVRGNNIMPHEIEWIAESAAAGGGSLRCGVFAVARGPEGEQPVVVVETHERGPEALAALDREIRLRVGKELSLPLADLVFVRRGKIPKTTSGKVQRKQLRELYLDGGLERLPAGEEPTS